MERTGVDQVEERVIRAAEAALARNHFVSPVDVLVGLGWLPQTRLDEWRQGRVDALETVREFFQEKKYPDSDLNELYLKLQDRLDFKANLNYIFIHPEPKDREMFFGEHFTLDPKTLQNVVTIGYKRAMSELRKYDLVPASTAPTPLATTSAPPAA